MLDPVGLKRNKANAWCSRSSWLLGKAPRRDGAIAYYMPKIQRKSVSGRGVSLIGALKSRCSSRLRVQDIPD